MGATVRDVVARELERAVRPDQSRLRVMVATHLQQLLTDGEDTDPIGDLDEDTKALVQALAELDEEYAAKDGRVWTPEQAAKHPRDPLTGRFLSVVAQLKDAVRNFDGAGKHPFKRFNREQLRMAARTRGIRLARGESKDSIAAKLLADLGRPANAPSSTSEHISPLTGQPVSQSAWAQQAAVDAATAGIPGVQLNRIPQIFATAPDAYRVDFNGVNVGTVHGNEADPTYEWVPFRPANASWHLRQPGGKPSKEAAVKELVDSYDAAQAPAAATPTLPSTDPAAKLIGNLIPASYSDMVAREAEIKQIVEERLNGQYAGLTVQVKEVNSSGGELEVEADIVDADGRWQGTTTRVFRETGGKLWVYHSYLSLRPQVQGQGFAEAWNGHLMNWYTESGLDRIEVTANIDVGGYTWARQGFDWKTKEEAVNIAARLRGQTIGPDARPYNAEQIATAEGIIDRINRLSFNDPDFPTAYEVSQAGRRPGQGRTDPWPGKDAMLGSTWSGVKPVPASGTAPVS